MFTHMFVGTYVGMYMFACDVSACHWIMQVAIGAMLVQTNMLSC